MIYQKSSLQFNRYCPPDWGQLHTYAEIADDEFTARQVDVYENGFCFRYDRVDWQDDDGSLGAMNLDADKLTEWRGPSESLSAGEFEKVWMTALDAPNQPQVYNHRFQTPSWLLRS